MLLIETSQNGEIKKNIIFANFLCIKVTIQGRSRKKEGWGGEPQTTVSAEKGVAPIPFFEKARGGIQAESTAFHIRAQLSFSLFHASARVARTAP